jgi:hypothetical protein
MRKQIELTCYCGKTYNKDLSEVIRNEKLGRINYCSKKCSGKIQAKYLVENNSNYNISQHSSNRRDDFTPFREHLRRAKRRDINCNLDLEYLKEIWDRQKGICPYSNVKLECVKEGKTNSKIYTMSLDRIDSSKGYIKNNVQFVSIAINLMKSNMTEIELQELLTILKK